jgi:thioredoxin reductase (NADPH)
LAPRSCRRRARPRALPGEDEQFEFELTGGATVRARAGVAANGVHYRRLDAAGVEELIGAGVHYGASPSEAALCRNCDVIVVGGANSLGRRRSTSRGCP